MTNLIQSKTLEQTNRKGNDKTNAMQSIGEKTNIPAHIVGFDALQKNLKWSCAACDGDSSTGCLSSTGECYR